MTFQSMAWAWKVQDGKRTWSGRVGSSRSDRGAFWKLQNHFLKQPQQGGGDCNRGAAAAGSRIWAGGGGSRMFMQLLRKSLGEWQASLKEALKLEPLPRGSSGRVWMGQSRSYMMCGPFEENPKWEPQRVRIWHTCTSQTSTSILQSRLNWAPQQQMGMKRQKLVKSSPTSSLTT